MSKALAEKDKAAARERSRGRSSQRRSQAAMKAFHKFDLQRMTQLCKLIASGRKVREACKLLKMSQQTVFHWTSSSKEAAIMYDTAIAARAESFVEETVQIADLLGEEANSRSVRIKARQWAASRLLPHKYGEKVKHDHGGAVTLIGLLVGAKQLAHEMVERGELPALPGTKP